MNFYQPIVLEGRRTKLSDIAMLLEVDFHVVYAVNYIVNYIMKIVDS
jgi:hypothetical protein